MGYVCSNVDSLLFSSAYVRHLVSDIMIGLIQYNYCPRKNFLKKEETRQNDRRDRHRKLRLSQLRIRLLSTISTVCQQAYLTMAICKPAKPIKVQASRQNSQRIGPSLTQYIRAVSKRDGIHVQLPPPVQETPSSAGASTVRSMLKGDMKQVELLHTGKCI